MPEGQKIKIQLKTMIGQTLEKDFSSNDTILDIKVYLQDQLGYPVYSGYYLLIPKCKRRFNDDDNDLQIGELL